MGLDIFLAAKPFVDSYPLNKDGSSFRGFQLSRLFAILISLQQDTVEEDETDLNQIGQITGVDILPLTQMANYEYLEGVDLAIYMDEVATSKSERMQIGRDAKKGRQVLENNLERVLHSITSLLDQLSQLQNLPDLLTDAGYSTLEDKQYFSYLSVDTIEDYYGYNFSQDLRNFKRFLEYAQSKGATTVWFTYG